MLTEQVGHAPPRVAGHGDGDEVAADGGGLEAADEVGREGRRGGVGLLDPDARLEVFGEP